MICGISLVVFVFFNILQKSGGKLAAGRVEIDESDQPAKKKRKVVSRVVRPTLDARFRGVDASFYDLDHAYKLEVLEI
jgi:hypothetical protein